MSLDEGAKCHHKNYYDVYIAYDIVSMFDENKISRFITFFN